MSDFSLKRFGNFINEMKIDDDELLKSFTNFDKFRHTLLNHPSAEDSTLVAVGVEEDFVEEEDGNYSKRYILQTNIMKITPDRSSFANVNGMKMRIQIQGGKSFLVIQWITNDIVDDMIDSIQNDDDDADFYLKTLVNHYREHTLGKKNRGRG